MRHLSGSPDRKLPRRWSSIPVRGSYTRMLESRAYQVQLLSVVPPVSVRVDGKTVVQAGEGKVGWWYDGEHTTLNILTGKTSSKNGAKVDVVLPSSPKANERR